MHINLQEEEEEEEALSTPNKQNNLSFILKQKFIIRIDKLITSQTLSFSFFFFLFYKLAKLFH